MNHSSMISRGDNRVHEDWDSGKWRSKWELQPEHNREVGWCGPTLEQKGDKLPFSPEAPKKIILEWTQADTWIIIQKTIQTQFFSSATYHQVVLNQSFTTEV